jgi:hypothetical protein
MDRRTRISILGLFGFVIMLVGTSKGPASGSGTSPWLDAGTGGEGGGEGGSGGAEDLGDAGAMSQGDASVKSPPRDGGARSPTGAADAGAPASGAKAVTSLPAPWDGMALPIGRGQIDAIRIVHPASDPRWIEKQYITSLRANGWTASRSEGDIASGMTTELTKADRRLIVRISKKDEDVVVSLNLL